MRPTKYLSKWSRRDRVLAESLLEYEAGLNHLGIPWDRASDPERKFEIDEAQDYAAAAYESAEAEYRRGENVEPGLRLIVVDKGKRDD